MLTRRTLAWDNRQEATEPAFLRSHPLHANNGEEAAYSNPPPAGGLSYITIGEKLGMLDGETVAAAQNLRCHGSACLKTTTFQTGDWHAGSLVICEIGDATSRL
jgi:hypothetical protein